MTIQSIDTQFLLFINRVLENEAFDVLMPALSHRGYLLVIPFLIAMFARAMDQTSEEGKTCFAAAVWTFLIACCAVFLAGLAEDTLKMAVARERPCRAIEGIRLIIPCPSSFSLPSGHATSSFAFALPLFHLTRDYIILMGRLYPLLLASLIAFSRVYLGVHYPMDVLAGVLLGSVIGLGLSILYQRVAAEYRIMPRKK